MSAARRRRRGAHAAPGARIALSVSQPRHGRLLPGPLPALLIGLTGSGLALIAALPGAATSLDQDGPPVKAASVLAPRLLDADERAQTRASRDRSVPEPEAAPLPSQAAAVPAPAPPAELLPGCEGRRVDPSGYRNGRLPGRVLCTLPGDSGEQLHADAAVSFVRLAAAYEKDFGTPICVTDGYRTLGEQQVLRRVKPRFAARPGSSEHGWGSAVDLACGVQSFRSRQHAWMVEHAARYGWYLPDWAQRGGSRPEPWHWQFGA